RARYYDAKTGRFISFDPILHPGNGVPVKSSCSQSISYPTFESLKENPQKLNPYVYVQNRPTVLTDPSGLMSEQSCYSGCMAICSSGVIIGCASACSAFVGLGPYAVPCYAGCLVVEYAVCDFGCKKSCKQCRQ
ncbi:MAG: hypothetical protein HY026_01410, partial [Deltaproteobacteria bacterium]|nr:hypothetical protein [Deltaproteobacteria bacterium]